jgi:PTH1 family peptidyl-tRNA hydrolase
MDLFFGKHKIATNSGSAGHNGIKSIIEHLNTQKFTRLRLGIKNALLKTYIPPDKFVLQPFSSSEKKQLKNDLKNFDLKNLK